jgi:hypothetical protein
MDEPPRGRFMDTIGRVDKALGEFEGPYFLGQEVSLIDW